MPRKQKTITRTIRIPEKLAQAVDSWAADLFPELGGGARLSANAATIILLWKGLEAAEAEQAQAYADRYEAKGGGK